MRLRSLPLAVLGLVALACSTAPAAPSASRPEPASGPEPSSTTAAAEEYPDAIVRHLRRLANEPRPVANSAMPPRHLDANRFPISLVERTRIVSGGPPPDGIPAIDQPVFQPAASVDWLEDGEAVLALRVGDAVRAYPVQVMVWHEIVNDSLAGVPVTVTYCPLCNSALAYDRRVDGRVLDFGTSGALYQSALVMYDRQTESLWTHFDGRAVVGTLVGAQLEFLPVSTVSWRDFRRAHPTAAVLTRDTGHDRPYGRNPYVGYDQSDGPLTGFFSGDVDAREAAMTRVVGVHRGGDSIAVVTERLADAGVVEATVDGRRITLWHAPGTSSALQAREVAGGDDVGATGVFAAEHGGRVLRFTRHGARFVDDRTGTTWNILGEAVAGPLAGERLRPVPHVDTFWFAWSTYRPGTVVLDPAGGDVRPSG